MPRPKIHDDDTRVALIEAAAALLSEAGPAALSLRRLAERTGTSTTAVYSLFGSKLGLLRAVFVEAFTRFTRRLRAAPETEEPVTDLLNLGLAYRRAARADPNLYAVMFGRPPGFELDEACEQVATAAFEELLARARRCTAAGLFPGVDEWQLAASCWSVVHGAVSLELAGTLPPGLAMDDHYERCLRLALGLPVAGQPEGSAGGGLTTARGSVDRMRARRNR